jgi:hypothetical protein
MNFAKLAALVVAGVLAAGCLAGGIVTCIASSDSPSSLSCTDWYYYSGPTNSSTTHQYSSLLYKCGPTNLDVIAASCCDTTCYCTKTITFEYTCLDLPSSSNSGSLSPPLLMIGIILILIGIVGLFFDVAYVIITCQEDASHD